MSSGPASDAWKSLILDHYKNPRHYGELHPHSVASEQHNRTCGDHVTVYAQISESGAHFGFVGAGCSLCLASASLMLDLVQDKSRGGVQAIRDEFQELWEKGLPDAETLPTWKALEGLRAYPVRSRCVKLAWQALDEILLAWV